MNINRIDYLLLLMRYHGKGGIWKNSEDEILKASVMKYGLNQWSRISSLLVRKSAKQCKERWVEWIDPNIKKTEWTKEEDEQLLQLSKMFPCQWKTIGDFIGRTAYQAMEHYEKLLDKAMNDDQNAGMDSRKLKPGEIDPNPETKPAKPDPIDMDEAEKDMLNEAKARIANRRGKKAKRKAREKQLEESRRLATLQKKRELRSAGIEIPVKLIRKKKKETNYSVDIPFDREYVPGYKNLQENWDVTEEIAPNSKSFEGGVSLDFLEGKRRDKDEEKLRQIDEKRLKNLKQKDLQKSFEVLNKLNDPVNIARKHLLDLPEPKISDIDMENMVKFAKQSGQSGIALPNRESANFLESNYLSKELMQVMTLRTPVVENKVLKEAKIAASIRDSETPLLGGENSATDLENYLSSMEAKLKNDIINNTLKEDKSFLFKTPSLYSQSAKNKNAIDLQSRDEMKLNNSDLENESSNFDKESNLSLIGDSNLLSKKRGHSYFENLFVSLPKPKYEYEITTPDQNLVVQEPEQTPINLGVFKEKKERLENYDHKLESSSRRLQPHLSLSEAQYFKSRSNAQQLVDKETRDMINYSILENADFPITEEDYENFLIESRNYENTLTGITEDKITEAKDHVCNLMHQFELPYKLDIDLIERVRSNEYNSSVIDYEAIKQKSTVIQNIKSSNSVKFKGYIDRLKKLDESIAKQASSLNEGKINLANYTILQVIEERVIEERLKEKESELNSIKKKVDYLQAEHASITKSINQFKGLHK